MGVGEAEGCQALQSREGLGGGDRRVELLGAWSCGERGEKGSAGRVPTSTSV